MLSFAFGSIPIRVHLSFWFTAAFLGMQNQDPLALIVFIGVVFLSVLLHELGHAAMGRAFGLAPQIELYAFGGATSWQGGNALSSGKRVLISLAGPFAGLAVTGITIAVCNAVGLGVVFSDLRFHLVSAAAQPPVSLPLLQFFAVMLMVNWLWSLFNLLPILPLDGGNVMAHTLAAATGGGGRRAAHLISVVVAVIVGAYFVLVDGNVFAALWLGLFAFQNIRALQTPKATPPPARQGW